MRIISIILHGRLWRKERYRQNLTALLANDHELRFYETKAVGNGRYQTSLAIRHGADTVVAAGGDGTLNEVVNGIMDEKEVGRGDVVLAVFPVGSANDFAKTMGLSDNPATLAQLLNKGHILPVDVGALWFTNSDMQNDKRHFINITDIGIGGVVAEIVNRSGKGLSPSLTYFKAIVQSFLTYKHRHIQMHGDGVDWHGKMLSLVLANGRYFGGGMCIAPQANLCDGQASVVVLGNVSLFDYFSNVANVRRGEILDHPEAHYLATTSCRIESSNGSCGIDMDGDFIGYTPLELTMKKGAIRMMVPSA